MKVRWSAKRGPEFTWEREDQMKQKYPHLFTKKEPMKQHQNFKYDTFLRKKQIVKQSSKKRPDLRRVFAIQEPPPAKAVTNQNIDGFIYIPVSKKIRKRENILIAENCMKANYELIFLWGEIAAFKIRPEVINPSEPTTFAAAI
ncbi:hypothetical protein LXL04_003861 [Taraxacum kok-saghyz]